MKKCLAFDLDGTLAPSKSQVPGVVADRLIRLLDQYTICVISGGRFEQFEKQLISQLGAQPEKLASLHLLPTCGTQYYVYEQNKWVKLYSEDLSTTEKKKIEDSIEKAITKFGFEKGKSYGPRIEDRGSQISWSALGQNIVDELGDEGVRMKEDWDRDGAKRDKILSALNDLIPEFECRSGGGTTIDITKPGIDKSYGMIKLMDRTGLKKDDILFFGDKLSEGGNDYPVRAMGIDCLEVSKWEDTAISLNAIALLN